MKYLFLCVVLFVFSETNLYCQVSKPRFLHYTPQHGLPSSQIYQVLQDNNGYLWFASDHGLAKYNGYEFKKFTSAEGLEDNTIFKLAMDPNNRIWMQSFSGRFFYVKNDRIVSYRYNRQLLNLVKNNIPLNFYVDSVENITFSCSQLGEFRIDNHGNITQLFNVNDRPGYNKFFVDEISTGKFVSSANTIFDAQIPSCLYYKNLAGEPDSLEITIEQGGGISLCRLKDDRLLISIANRVYDFKGDQLNLLYELPSTINYITQDREGRIWISTYTGIYHFDFTSVFTKKGTFLEDEFVTCSYQDFEGGFWISTVNDGVYYLNDLRINSFDFEDTQLKEPLCLSTDGSKVYAGFWSGGLAAFDHDQYNIIFPLGAGDYITGVFNDTIEHKILLAKKFPGFLQNGKFYFLKSDGTRSLKGRFIKQKEGTLLNASINAIYKIESDSFYQFSTIYKRTNCVFEAEPGTLFLGTNSGAFKLNPDNNFSAIIHNALSGIRVDDIAKFRDIYCFATRGKGLMLMRNDTIYFVKSKDGLSGDMINRITVSDSAIWCCSFNGVSRVMIKDFKSGSFEISNVSMHEGLPDNEINDILICKDTLWLATKKSISFFDVRTDFHNRVAPKLRFTNFSVNNKDVFFDSVINLPHDENNISIGFEAISYKSNGNIIYKYFLVSGVDTFVSTTSSRHVEFLALKPGVYAFQVSAMNSNGTWTFAPLRFSFVVLAPFWQQWWFFLLLIGLASALVYAYLRSRIRIVKEREQLKSDFNMQLLSLEMKALRAQMNPHFIFNVINSIQDYILKNDARSAQKYLTKFARLVRLILDNSVAGEVLLSEEIRANELYMELEQQRFDGKFDFILKISPGTETDAILIPSMMIQPFLENAIKHGIQHLSGKGCISLMIDQSDTELLIVIEDNGVGRAAAAEWNKINVQDHVSHGSTITLKRVSAHNEAYKSNIKLRVIDLFKPGEISNGTRVELSIPLKFIDTNDSNI